MGDHLMSVYEDYQLRLAPPWLRRTNGEKVERVYGREKDTQLDRANQALVAGLPGYGPTDALGFIGAERMLPRISGEASNVYAERLRTAWSSLGGWSYAGSHGSLLRALERAGFPMGTPNGCHVVQKTRRFSYLAGSTVTFGTHPGMTWDGLGPEYWNQFGIIFGADVVAGGALPDDLEEGSRSADTLNKIVRQWKPAKARFMGTWVVVTAPVYGWPVGTQWGQVGLDWGESDSRFISPT